MKETDLAWAAGIIDGEGCIALTRTKQSYRLRLWVGNTDERMAMEMCEIFGGNICDTNAHGTPYYVWYINGKAIAEVLEQVYDYLVIKQEEANIAIAFAETIKGPGKITDEIREEREDMFEQLSALGSRRRREEVRV